MMKLEMVLPQKVNFLAVQRADRNHDLKPPWSADVSYLCITHKNEPGWRHVRQVPGAACHMAVSAEGGWCGSCCICSCYLGQPLAALGTAMGLSHDLALWGPFTCSEECKLKNKRLEPNSHFLGN